MVATTALMFGAATAVTSPSDRGAAQPGPAVSQPAAPAGPSGKRRWRVPAELSDHLIHSPLVACGGRRASAGAARRRVRVATWNIAAGLAAPIDALVDELKGMKADIVALQEVDVDTRRAGFVDEPVLLAKGLGFQYAFAASIRWDEGHYGLAVLSRWPLTDVRRHRLSVVEPSEPRIVLEATVCAGGRALRIFNHHADRRVAARETGFRELRDLLRPDLGRGLMVLGDLNEYPDGPGVRGMIDTGFVDLGAGLDERTTRNGRIDYLMADGPLARRAGPARVWRTERSDHHAVLVDLEW
jgi:endonuclease/exonuclease/phosphatase family metal-dependent hydrolase